MTVMVVGGDHLGGIKGNLKKKGYDKVKHLSGRKPGHVRKSISESLDLVLVLTDYVGTDLSRQVKTRAKECKTRIVFARRSWACIAKEMDRIHCDGCENNRSCPANPHSRPPIRSMLK